MEGLSADRGDWPASVEIEEVVAELAESELVIFIRYTDTRYPNLELGARFTVGSTFWTEGGLDAEWAASHAAIYFGEATFAGGDPGSRDADSDSVRWYRDTLL